MKAVLFDYPDKAAFGRVLPKSKIYVHANPSSKVKKLFVSQVEQIVWQYKLAPETVNLPQTRSVPEIQIFSIALRERGLKPEVLRCIDQAIRFPIIFELHYGMKCKVTAAYKRSSEADAAKWVVSDYFESSWLSNNAKRSTLPLVLNLEALYERLLEPLIPYSALPGEGLQGQVERMGLIFSKQKEIDKVEASLRKEKQFNIKVDINAELRALKQELEALTGCPTAVKS